MVADMRALISQQRGGPEALTLADLPEPEPVPTRSLALIRQLAWPAADGDWPATLGLERNLQREAGRSEDFAEGVAAFVEKRQSRFSGA